MSFLITRITASRATSRMRNKKYTYISLARARSFGDATQIFRKDGTIQFSYSR